MQGFPSECHVEQPGDPEKCVAATKGIILHRKLASCNNALLQARSMKTLHLFSLLDSADYELLKTSAINATGFVKAAPVTTK